MENNAEYRENEVQTLAKEQWLLNDLKDICPGSLPQNLRNQHKISITGRFVLQINACVDIGTPAYQQYLKLQKVNTENIEATTNNDEKIPSHRMIKLYLTDGVQEVSGIEYRPMRNLSCDITPGCKLLLKGPVICRRGVMLLTEANVELLGGEVQELADENSLVQLLASKLGLPATIPQENTTNNTIQRTTNSSAQTFNDDRQYEPTFGQTSDQRNRTEPIDEEAFGTFDDDIDVDQLAAIEAQILDNPNKRISDENYSRPDKKAKINENTVNCVDDYPDDEDIMFEDEDYIRDMEAQFDAHDIELNAHINKDPKPVSVEPFVYIKQINELSESEREGKVFKVKGQIIKLLSKLFVSKEGWSLKCAIVDGTGSLDVDFTSDVLSKLVGLTPVEMNQIKKEIATKPELKKQTIVALENAKKSLQVLYCIIELTMSGGPKITRLIPFDNSHVEKLKERQ
ncbi:PREDICTED: recQ-mediated genome instability protein 1-like isoform X2 [Papilio polytes]|nr:PREDICTED: recQ-mediated genome instability protein 1-like isoform X2 [Papilio polytes]XP_013140847.1 PREDICTED: recQ-mediated genome instability protein 1-like isoform X2 [Papilio polytes]